MPDWTAETVLALAPDAASGAAGRGLADATKWQSAGANAAAAWGEAKGSGAKPYQVTVDLGDGASRCACPSRKFPCKHALGLLLRVAKGDVPAGAPPAWATEWLEKRGQKAASPKAVATPNPKAVEKRWETVLKGLDECEAFLRDAVGNGLLSMGAARTWDGMAARMVDAQAPGVARRLREIGSAVGVDNAQAAAEMGSLALLIEAARRLDALGDLAHDVRTAVGIPFRKEDATGSVVDVWDVLGSHPEEAERLWTCHTWLRGRGTGRWALSLAFAPLGGKAPPRLPAGAAFAMEVRFFPSVWPLRASLEESPERVGFVPPKGENWNDALEAQADALARNPWIDRFPVVLADAVFAREGERWFVLDADGVGMPLRASDEARWQILARTGNRPRSMFGEFDGEAFFWLADWEART